jgi:hypothetical protein
MMMMMVPDYRIWSPGKGGIFCMLMRGNLSVFLEAPKPLFIFLFLFIYIYKYISLFARKRKKKEKWKIEIKHENIF